MASFNWLIPLFTIETDSYSLAPQLKRCIPLPIGGLDPDPLRRNEV
jgi:hypothetical protein